MVQVSPKVLNVTIGQTASLDCNFLTNQPMNNLMVQWSLYPWIAETPVPSGKFIIGPRFQNRLKILSKMGIDMNASISISDMQTADTGTYTCEVHNLPDIEGVTEANARVHVFGVKNGILYIRNITQFEFGTYQCNASNVMGSTICTIDLNSDLNKAAIVGAVIGALLCVAFIMLLVWFITHHLKKKKYNTAKANETQPAVNYKAVPPQDSAPE
ncbi:V-set and immunoglobulin domain-containing protein 1 [Bagarius yarrelli]|nr:V-set and immunoglobulin domain-containing protein 1 [Bagarius yarrelli]